MNRRTFVAGVLASCFGVKLVKAEPPSCAYRSDSPVPLCERGKLYIPCEGCPRRTRTRSAVTQSTMEWRYGEWEKMLRHAFNYRADHIRMRDLINK